MPKVLRVEIGIVGERVTKVFTFFGHQKDGSAIDPLLIVSVDALEGWQFATIHQRSMLMVANDGKLKVVDCVLGALVGGPSGPAFVYMTADDLSLFQGEQRIEYELLRCHNIIPFDDRAWQRVALRRKSD